MTHAAGHDFWASLDKNSPRYAAWAQVFDDPQHVPITTPLTESVNLPIGVRPVLFVAYDLLLPSEQARLILYLAVQFHIDPQEVQDQIEADPRHGVPMLSEDVSIAVLRPQRWFS
jgi:hypothetical protein